MIIFLDTANVDEIREMAELGIIDGVTTNPSLLAAEAGASYVSPFVGRLDDAGHEGMQVATEIRTILDNYDLKTKIITSSARHPMHMAEAAIIGSDVVTLPYDVLTKALRHPLTDVGVARFIADWEVAANRPAPRGGEKE